jgi:P27 family predicted phage terminase small subunit
MQAARPASSARRAVGSTQKGYVMKTGRPATPPDLQRLKGDPRKKGARVLEAEAAAAAKAEARAETLAPAKYDVPSYLTDRAQDIFRRAADQLLPANIIRPLDLGSLARWAALSDSWIAACEDANGKGRWYLAKSKHNPEGMMRRNPAVTDMLDFNSELIKLETLLGITPLSRQAILRGLQALPKGSLGGLFRIASRARARKTSPIKAKPKTKTRRGRRGAGLAARLPGAVEQHEELKRNGRPKRKAKARPECRRAFGVKTSAACSAGMGGAG